MDPAVASGRGTEREKKLDATSRFGAAWDVCDGLSQTAVRSPDLPVPPARSFLPHTSSASSSLCASPLSSPHPWRRRLNGIGECTCRLTRPPSHCFSLRHTHKQTAILNLKQLATAQKSGYLLGGLPDIGLTNLADLLVDDLLDEILIPLKGYCCSALSTL